MGRSSVELFREVVAELVRDEYRLRVINHLDDPSDSWIQLSGGPYTTTVERDWTQERYIRLRLCFLCGPIHPRLKRRLDSWIIPANGQALLTCRLDLVRRDGPDALGRRVFHRLRGHHFPVIADLTPNLRITFA